MRTIYVLSAIFLLVTVGANPSVAEIYRPWCAQYFGFNDGATNCSFTSYAQCMMTAGPGTGAYCVQNPWYLAYGAGSGKVDPAGRGRRARR
jgi:uncharacterized protein DUF3551